jgi:hypothetical protein
MYRSAAGRWNRFEPLFHRFAATGFLVPVGILR